MWTQAVLTATLSLLSLSASALYFPSAAHNHPHFPSAGGIIDVDLPPTRIVRRQVAPSSTAQPILTIASMNSSSWATDTNTLCLHAINASAIINPAGVIPCYNVLMYNPNNGDFLSEVRLFQVNNMVQTSVVDEATGSGVLFEFPHATIDGSPGDPDIQDLLSKRGLVRRAASDGDVTIVDAFYMNGTADITAGLSAQNLLTPTAATISLNMSGVFTPYSMTASIVLFANGLFSASFNASQTTNNTTATAADTTSTAFVLPGTTFGIVPIGFYLYSAYWGVFTIVLLWGAWNKRKYRDAFRRRRAAVLNFTAVKSSY